MSFVIREICMILDALRPDVESRHERLVTFVTDRPRHDSCYATDASNWRRELEWMPRENFSSGMRKTIVWHLENTPWCERVNTGAYRAERLGPVGIEGAV